MQGIMQAYAMAKMKKRAIGPIHLFSPSQVKNHSNTARVMSLLTITKIVPPITMKAISALTTHFQQGVGPSSSSDSSGF